MKTTHHSSTAAPHMVAVVVLLVGCTGLVHAQQTEAPDLSLETLMQMTVEPVFGASLRLQPVTEAPASVTIVTAGDIERHGYETLAEVLASVRGFHVANDRNYSYLGTRGFALPGDYNTRVLLLVDGHRMNDAIYEQASIGREFPLALLSIERVEIIRGPASALYGTSAFFAVVNVVTRTGAALNGIRTSVQAGSFGSRIARIAGGRLFDSGVDVALAASVGASDGADRLYFPEFDTPETANGVATGIDGEDYRQISGRVTVGRLSLSGAAASRDKQVPTAAYETAFGNPQFDTTDARAYLHARYERTLDGTQLTLQSSIDRYQYHGEYPYWVDEPGSDVSLLRDFSEGRWWSVDGRLSRTFGDRHTVTAGAELRHTFHEVQRGGYDDAPESSFLISNRSEFAAIYAQDELAVNRHLLFTAGLRYDHYAGFDRVTPRFSAIVKTSDDQAFKYLFGNAFRAPNAYELDYYSHPLRRLDLEPETITSHEVAWERYTGRWLRTSASAYLNAIDDLITFSGNDQGEYRFENVGRVRSRGLELEAEARFRSGIRSQVSYVLQEATDREEGVRLTNSPRHALTLQGSAEGPRQSTGSLSVHYLGSRRTLGNTEVDPVLLMNASLRVPIGGGLLISGVVRNLLDRRYADPGSAEHLQLAIPQDGRAVLIGLEWNTGGN